jgi:hypothetical protein
VAPSGAPEESAPPATAESGAARRSKTEARTRRKPAETRATSGREKSKEQRRSKLIDPYR